MRTSIKSETDRTSERILARQLARELTQEELQVISGGKKEMVQMANCSCTNTCTVQSDWDGGPDD